MGGTAVLLSAHRSFPKRTGLRQLRIQDGQLREIGHDDAPVAADARVVEVHLLATDRASDRERVAAIPGISYTRLEEPQGHLLLLTDRLQIDGVLIEAIAQGWSVRSVRDVPREGGPA